MTDRNNNTADAADAKGLFDDIPAIDFKFPKKDDVISTNDSRIIKVVGVGGGGGNAVARMYGEGLNDVRFEVCNTDQAALDCSPVPAQRLISKDGLGVGGDPAKGRKCAEDYVDSIRGMFDDGTRMVFLTAGMGGGTGTGASPVIAREARKAGVLTVGVVTIPFAHEREARIDRALDGVFELSKCVDSLLIINNERLCEICAYKTLIEALNLSDDTLYNAVKSIADIITTPMYWNLDFNDVSMVLKDGGIALISSGEAEGENRLQEAISQAIESPLLNDNDIFNARRATVAIYSSDNKEDGLTMAEMGELDVFMRKFTNSDFDVKIGHGFLPNMGKKIRITVLASGFGLATKPYVAAEMQETAPKTEDKESNLIIKDRETRRESFYGKSKKKKPMRLTYLFSDSDLDNDLLIDRISDSDTKSRRVDGYRSIERSSLDYKAGPVTAMAAATSQPGKILFEP